MSNKELAKNLIDQIPESKMIYIIAYLQGAALPDETPNQETSLAITEAEEMISNNGGEHFTGSTKDFLSSIMEE